MTRTLISNGRLIDGRGGAPVDGAALLIDDARIVAAGPTSDVRGQAGAQGGYAEIDATGKTVMPGLVDGHVHLNFHQQRTSNDLDMQYPAVYLGMLALRHAGMLLEGGITGAVGGGAQFTADVWVQRAIKSGLGRGPRMLTCSREITTTGGSVDWHPSWQRVGIEALGYVADGPHEMVKAVRTLLKEGPDAVKIYTSGEGTHTADFHPQMYDCTQDRECMTYEEIQAAVDEAHRWKRAVIAHTRDTQSIKNCVRAGVDIILHASFIDEEGIEWMVKKPPRAVVPAFMPLKAYVAAYHAGRISKAHFESTRYQEELEVALRNIKRLHGLGIRIVPGGEYGLAREMPHGANARDLQLFVEDLGFTPMEAICAATRDAAYLMAMEHELGTLEPGRLADLLVVEGDPLADIAVLQDRSKLAVVMKDGEVQAARGKLIPL